MSALSTPTKKPALTPVGTGNAALDAWVKKVCEIHEVEEGTRGKGDRFRLDKKPSYRDLVKLGLVIPMDRGRGLKFLGDPVDGFVPGNGADPSPDYSQPDVPQNVTATGGFGVIFIDWDDPFAVAPIPFFSHAEIWRSATDNLGTAILLGTTVSSLYDDSVGSGQTFYYWVRFVNDVKGTVVYGPFNATAGTEATSADDVDYILDSLTGLITETHLYSTLNERIDLIDGAVGLEGSVDARINAEAIIREDEDEALASSITSLGATVSGNTAAIVSEATTRATADSAIASDITTLQTTVGGHTASISTLTSTTNGLAAQYYVKLDVNGYVSGFGIASSGGSSTFLINADNFAIGKPGYAGETPFVLGTVAGVTRIALNAATYIPDATIVEAKIGTAAVTTAKIQDAAIVTAKINDAAITSAKIGFLQVTNALIADAAVSTAKIESLAVTTAKIGDLQVETLKIADNAVTVPQYTSGTGGTITTSWSSAASITVNWGSNIPAGISVSGSVNCLAGGSGDESLAIRFRQGSTGATDGDVGISAASGFSVGLTGTAGFVPSSSTETYYIEVKKVGGATYTMGAKNLLLIGIKK